MKSIRLSMNEEQLEFLLKLIIESKTNTANNIIKQLYQKLEIAKIRLIDENLR